MLLQKQNEVKVPLWRVGRVVAILFENIVVQAFGCAVCNNSGLLEILTNEITKTVVTIVVLVVHGNKGSDNKTINKYYDLFEYDCVINKQERKKYVVLF